MSILKIHWCCYIYSKLSYNKNTFLNYVHRDLKNTEFILKNISNVRRVKCERTAALLKTLSS